MLPQWLGRLAPGLAALTRYERSWFRHDLVAGVSVAAVAIPVAIANAQLAGVPPVNGLYTCIPPLLAYAIFGTSRQLILSLDGATCAIVAAVIVPLAGGDPQRSVELAMTLSVFTGVACIFAGLARLGFLTTLLARPILAGYINGLAISIIMGQLGRLFGLALQPAGFFRQLARFLAALPGTHPATLAVGLGTLAVLVLVKRLSRRVPAPLVAVVLAITASRVLRLEEHGVRVLGAIPGGLPPPRWPNLPAHDLEALAYGALGLALISFSSAMVTARGFAAKNRYDIDANQEFVALGVADIGSGLLQGIAVSGADSRTAMNDSMGGKSQVAGLVAAAVVLLALLFFTRGLSALPAAALAAVLIHAVSQLFDFEGLVRFWRVNRVEFLLSCTTLLGVITVGILPGVGVAIGLALLMLLVRVGRPHVAVLGCVPGTNDFRGVERHPEARPLPGILILRYDSQLVFFNADHFKTHLRAAVAAASPPVRHVVLAAQSIPLIDSTGASVLEEAAAELSEGGVTLRVAGMNSEARDVLERTGFVGRLGADHFHASVASAVAGLAGPPG